MVKAVYIHIPFCKTICSYCDFCKRFYDEKLVDNYLDELKKEVISNYRNEQIETIYIGGGTPSCLSLKQLKKLFEIIDLFDIDNMKEFTFECNINDIDEEKFKFLFLHHVNRLSIGIETTNEKLLEKLNRVHSKDEIINNISILRKIGFKNINIDLMYAIHGETIDDLKNDLNFVLSLNVEHISAYSLIIEENTPIFINNMKQIDEELDLNMYNLICDTLENSGYIHYEISNFSKKDYESKHNLVYWNNEEYYGFGLGSTGYINSIRYTNTRSLKNYLFGNYILDSEKEDINRQIENEIMLGLRKIKGINKKVFFKKYNKDIYDIFDLKKYINNNYLIDDGENIFVNKKYLYVENSILLDFIGGINE